MAYISCDNCRHFNVPVNQQPCKDCVRNHDFCGDWSHHEMVKGCTNCLHSKQPATAPSCNDCIRTLDTEKYWVSCHTYDEERPDICCPTCKHRDLSPGCEHCLTCICAEEDYSEWEEREHDGKKAEDY